MAKEKHILVGLGKRIQKARNSARFTQEEFAEAIGVSRNAVAQWEKDVKEPSISHLIQIAQSTKVSVDYLLNISPEKQNNGRMISRKALEILQELMEELS